jgi:hypothetical protein
LAVHGFADNFYCRIVLHQRSQTRKHKTMVVSEQYADWIAQLPTTIMTEFGRKELCRDRRLVL